jgi:glycosyltransferase involved in cell wall biosynthesis
LSEQEHVELFVTLLSVFNVLLARYSRQEGIVVATAVGGIPEQVKGLEVAEEQSQTAQLNRYGTNEATGILVPSGDAPGMALGIDRLLNDNPLRRRMGENAARDARERFDLRRQVDSYLARVVRENTIR